MKLDVDALAHPEFFSHLMPVLETAPARAFFNVGMFQIREATTKYLLLRQPLTVEIYRRVFSAPAPYCDGAYMGPVGSNFVCRRDDYLALGGCDARFCGYGWEDYYQLYKLEWYERGGRDPLPGPISIENVTQRCRDEISRRKSRQLVGRDPLLALLHCWHPRTARDPKAMLANKRLLLEMILRTRGGANLGQT
jgi:hypothetical protein